MLSATGITCPELSESDVDYCEKSSICKSTQYVVLNLQAKHKKISPLNLLQSVFYFNLGFLVGKFFLYMLNFI